MSSDASEWLTAFDAAQHKVQSVLAESRDTVQNPDTSSKERRILSRKLNGLRDESNKLDRQLSRMEAQPATFRIGEGELLRRRQLLNALKQSLSQTDDVIQGKTPSARKKDLLRGARDTDGGETEETRDMNNRQIAEQQQQMLTKQDEQLDQVLDGVTRLKTMGQDIHTELDLHKHLLDDLDEAIDRTDERLRMNTQRVDTVNEKAGGCCALLTIVLLFVLIIILISSNYACHIFNTDRC